MNTTYIHLLGDSTLDNYYWMQLNEETNATPENDSVEGQLQQRLNSENPGAYRVISHAYDGFTTSSVLDGDDVGSVLYIHPEFSLTPWKEAYLKHKNISPHSSTYRVFPLIHLKEAVQTDPDAIHYVVISVGGNDFRRNLHSPFKLLTEIFHIHARYFKIVDEVQDISNNIRPILLFQYRPDATNDQYGIYRILHKIGIAAASVHFLCMSLISGSVVLFLAGIVNGRASLVIAAIGIAFLAVSSSIIPLKITKDAITGKNTGIAMLGRLMEMFYRPILARVKEGNISVLDLPKTFNPFNKTLYLSGIEPSKAGGKLIAEGISYIVQHGYTYRTCMIYSKTDSDNAFYASANSYPSRWKVGYPQI